ncbi:MAG: ABC transporter permease [Candidatus Nanoarchaeia archaeon]
MRLRKALELAWNTLIHSKLRSWLTIIGIVIGIAAVVTIISVSQGAEMSIRSQLNGLGTNIITISPGAERATGVGAQFRVGGGSSSGGSTTKGNEITQATKNLTNSDVSILKTVPNVEYIMGTYSGRAQVTYLGANASANIEGINTQLWPYFIAGVNLAEGRYLTQSDSYSVVVGSNIANSIFSGLSVNQNILINGTMFDVVGILNQSGSQDDSEIFMPITSARQVLGDVGGINFGSILVEVSNTSQTNQTITDITNTLMLERGILQQKNIDFSVSSPLSFQQTISSALSSLSLFLEAIAAISLLVGAIGISNTMFTSVLEKTKEIGVMKSIGAKNRDILMIFLFKAGMLGLIGGIGGVMLGVVASLFIGQAGGLSIGIVRGTLTSYINPWLLIGTFFISMLIGMIAGAIPAYRASKLNPIEALRYE